MGHIKYNAGETNGDNNGRRWDYTWCAVVTLHDPLRPRVAGPTAGSANLYLK